jgi:hypothetical protein
VRSLEGYRGLSLRRVIGSLARARKVINRGKTAKSRLAKGMKERAARGEYERGVLVDDPAYAEQ